MRRKQRTIMLDPHRSKVLREAWDLLLSGQYTLMEICQELHDRGYTRKSGKPWVWQDPETGTTCTASPELLQIFKNPFYAGWAVSKAYGYKRGDQRGVWPALVTDREFDEGIEILRHGDGRRDTYYRHVYLLATILFMRMDDGRDHVMYGSTPQGRTKHYPYYKTKACANVKQIRINREAMDARIPDLLAGLQVNPELMPAIRSTYEGHARQIKGPGVTERMADLKAMLESIKAEEADYARLLARGKLSEANYDLLHDELELRTAKVRQDMHHLTSGTQALLDGLDQALLLLSHVVELYERLDIKAQRRMLRILFKRIIIDTEARILEVEPNPPFDYLNRIAGTSGSHGSQRGGLTPDSNGKITGSLLQRQILSIDPYLLVSYEWLLTGGRPGFLFCTSGRSRSSGWTNQFAPIFLAGSVPDSISLRTARSVMPSRSAA